MPNKSANDSVEDTEHYFLLCRIYDANVPGVPEENATDLIGDSSKNLDPMKSE